MYIYIYIYKYISSYINIRILKRENINALTYSHK